MDKEIKWAMEVFSELVQAARTPDRLALMKCFEVGTDKPVWVLTASGVADDDAWLPLGRIYEEKEHPVPLVAVAQDEEEHAFSDKSAEQVLQHKIEDLLAWHSVHDVLTELSMCVGRFSDDMDAHVLSCQIQRVANSIPL